jgi:hypothetical protein
VGGGSADRVFYTDAIRDENSTKWYWKTSGNSIQDSEFHWGETQPSLENSTELLGIVFSAIGGGGGYKDVGPEEDWFDVICQ